jgi:uncharacterized glyoxalase superfamily protein PhnB
VTSSRSRSLGDPGPADRDYGMRTLTVADPDGYAWGIAQDLP